MAEPGTLSGACVWKGAEIARDRRWVREFPAALLSQIDAALGKVRGIDWRRVDRSNFVLPDAPAFFDDVREELENGSGMVMIRGLDVRRYDTDDLRRIWFGLGRYLGTPMFQNCRGEVMREIKDAGVTACASRRSRRPS